MHAFHRTAMMQFNRESIAISGASRSAIVSRRRISRAFAPSTSTSAGRMPRVVVRALRHAISAGIEQGHQIARLDRLQVRGRAQKSRPTRTPAPPHPQCGLSRPRPYRHNLVMRLVERRADQVVHRRVGNDKCLFAVLLHMQHARHQRPGLRHEEPPRLQHQRALETRQRIFDCRGILAHLGSRIKTPRVVIDAQPAARIDGLERDALALAVAAPVCITRSIAAPNGSAERICEPMCTLTPCASSQRLPAALL